MGTRIGAPLKFGIQYSHSRRQLLVGHVMVAYYEIDTEFTRILNFFYRLYSTIKDYNELDPRSGGLVNSPD